MAKEKTVFQRLTDVLIGYGNGNSSPTMPAKSVSYDLTDKSRVLFSTDNKDERDAKLAALKQQRLQSYMWKKTGYETSMEQTIGSTQVRIMYRDADLMAQGMPEIGAGLEILAEEATTMNKDGKILNIYSKSDRIKSVLEDLFYNRLDFNVWSTTIVHETCKYGNEFMFLNLDMENGVMGWREMPVHEMRRLENGMESAFGGGAGFNPTYNNMKPDEVTFIWDGHNETMPFKAWNIAHFRLITDSLYLPYGCSWLNKARRHWRMLSMMEDAMLLYRLERSIERRIFKVNVGLIDDADVPAYVQEFMNTVKRAPIIDPQTGQLDLRKNFLDVSADYVIPVRNQQDPSSIETLQSAQNPTSMDDINYMENKILAALRIPKTFLNFQEAQGKGQNLSLLDIRFNRTVNRVQQAILMELNKIAIIHLYLLGYQDDLTNFTLSFDNPSNQIDMMELDNLQKRIGAASSALAEQGGGIPIMSWHMVQKKIMGLTDTEIAQLLEEIRLEAALAIELQKTYEIIKNTHMFDKVDRIYGEPGAKYSPGMPGEDGGLGGGLGGGGGAPMMGGGDFDDGLGDIGEPGGDMEGDIGGSEGGADLGGMDAANPSPLNEIISKNPWELLESYSETLRKGDTPRMENIPIINKALRINESIESLLSGIEQDKSKDSEELAEAIEALEE